MNTQEMRELDRDVANVLGYRQVSDLYWVDANGIAICDGTPYAPTTDGNIMVDLMEEFGVSVIKTKLPNGKGYHWEAVPEEEKYECAFGSTPQIAVAKCVLATGNKK